MITLDQAKNLKSGNILYHTVNKNADGSAQRWKVNGKPKTWKTHPERVSIPVKYGLYVYDHITDLDLHLVSLNEGGE